MDQSQGRECQHADERAAAVGVHLMILYFFPGFFRGAGANLARWPSAVHFGF
jgi:hypothetical protein